MRRALIVSGKAGGLQAMIPMIEHFLASGRWEVRVALWDQHRTARAAEVRLPAGVRMALDSAWGEAAPDDRVGWLLQDAYWLDCQLSDTAVVIVYGDRLDALLGATVAHEAGIPVAHLQAGDMSGGIDHANRYATTALSTWAFCATEEMYFRLQRFQEECGLEFYARLVGDHHIDAIKCISVPPQEKTDEWVVHLHPDTLATEGENRRIAEMVVGAVGPKGYYIMPCTDRGHEVILDVYRQRGIEVSRYLPLEEYIALLHRSRGLIGNSSACVIDAPALGIPAILVGGRQSRRGGFSVWSYFELVEAMHPSRWVDVPIDTTYGDGEAGRRTFEILDREV